MTAFDAVRYRFAEESVTGDGCLHLKGWNAAGGDRRKGTMNCVGTDATLFSVDVFRSVIKLGVRAYHIGAGDQLCRSNSVVRR